MPAQQGAAGRLEAGQVEAMFDRIAGVYDLMNTAMTAGLHHRWRARAADLARVGPGSRVLDVATGTGDLAIELARRVSPGGEVVGSDFAEGMVARARAKTSAVDERERPRFEWGNALELPYADGSFDAATVGFGARNFADLSRGLAEMARVVRPGGRVVVLEITTPTKPPLAQFYSLWFDRLVPALGASAGLLAKAGRKPTGDASANGTIADAYTYLPNSVKRFPAPPLLAAELERAGLEEIGYVLTAGGIVAIHFGTVPEGIDAVEAIMRRGGEGLRERMTRVELHLERVTARSGSPLAAHANATVVAGGKRLRPLLVVLAAESGGGPPATPEGEERLIRAAVAVELVHSATLVHDDLIDGALLRRGHPTVAAVAGRKVAIATGDLLFSRAFAELARNGDSEQLRALSDASSALAAGELLQREDSYASHVAVERYLRRCELKTAALFEAACRLGALNAVEGSPALADALGAFARRIGLAFQLLDDVLDVSGPVERTGKSRGTDLLDGTITLPFILAREREPDLAALDLASLEGPEQAECLCERIAATGALDQAREQALALVAEAKAALPEILSGARAALLELVADAVVERYR